MIFACLFAANVYYRLFGKLQKRLLLDFWITTKSVITIYYSKYGKLLKSLEDQLILDNNKIQKDVRNVGDIKKAKNTEDRGDTGDVRKIKNTGDIKNAVDIRNKEVKRGNNRAANRVDQENNKVGNNKVGDDRDKKANKVGYDRVSNRMSIGRDPEGVKISNKGVDDSNNQDNQYETVENIVDFNNRVTIVVDLIVGAFVDILVYFSGPLSFQSNLLLSIITTRSGQSYDNKFKFCLFTFLLTLLQDLT